MKRFALVALAGCAIAVPSRAVGQDAGAILDRAVAAYGQVRTMRADFTQTIHDEMLGADETTHGEFLQQRPDRFAMRWRQPSGDLILADGQYLWVFLPSSAPNQVARSALSSRPGESADIVAEFLDRPRERFAVSYDRSDGVDRRAADVLALTPRDRNAPYRRVKVWVDRQDYLVRRVEISESSGAVRSVTFDRLTINQPIPAASFTFRPPPGVRVVDTTH